MIYITNEEFLRRLPKGWSWRITTDDNHTSWLVVEKDVPFDLFTFNDTPYWRVPLKVTDDYKVLVNCFEAKAYHMDNAGLFEEWLCNT